MARSDPPSATPVTHAVPAVRLELRQGSAPAIPYHIPLEGFLIGSVAGCDLRLPGTNLPPVVCLITPCTGGPGIRRLAPAQGILLNGKPLTSDALQDGDILTIGDVQLHVTVDGVMAAQRQAVRSQLEHRLEDLELVRKELEQQKQALHVEQVSWYHRRDEMEKDYQQHEQSKQALAADRQACTRREQEVTRREQAAEARQRELEQMRQDLAGLREQFQARYRERRDRLANLQEAVDRAARKVQESKRRIDAEAKALVEEQQTYAQRCADLERRDLGLDRTRAALAARERELEQMHEECRGRECQIAEERAELARDQAQLQADLLRLDRARADLERREQEYQARIQDLDNQTQKLSREKRDHDDQDKQLHDWHTQLCAESDRLAKRDEELQAAARKLDERSTRLEEQEAAQAAVRARLEQTRDDQRREDVQLAEQRIKLDGLQAEANTKLQEAERRQAELDVERMEVEHLRKQLDEDRLRLQTEMDRFKGIGEGLREQEELQKQRAVQLEVEAARLAEQIQLFHARAEQVQEIQGRVVTARQSLRDREAALSQSEQARQTLQEQLRRRSEELAEKQKQLDEQAAQQAALVADLDRRHAQAEADRQGAEQRLAELHSQIEIKRKELDDVHSELAEREQLVARHLDKLKESGRAVAQAKKTVNEERTLWQAQKEAEESALARARVDLERIRSETDTLQSQLPDLELNARSALERLQSAREQLAEHLAEMHAYARLRHEDLEGLRLQVQEEGNRLQQQLALLHKGRDDYRHAVATFRQQIIAWQGQVADLKRSLATDETRLERKQAVVEETSARLAVQAVQLETKEKQVEEKRSTVDRHLTDMRDWYKDKLRDLASSCEPAAEKIESAPAAEPRDILRISEEVDPGDRQLGDLLRKLELVDADTLAALLLEARRQRRSLRQVLLTSGHVSVYQMALIEAGNLDGLMLGPVRVIDRLRVTLQESVYRVFDPRRGGFALLRHLSEAEMLDAVHPDEFRQRFAAAAVVRDQHVAATYEVLDIVGRPAALQELVAGLPAVEWQELASAPGVCYRLLTQAACGLNAAHQAGLVHGRLDPTDFFLTADGKLKIAGFGEPDWLHPDAAVPEASAAADLSALGRTAADWLVPSPRGKGSKSKALKPLLEIIQKLSAESDELRFTSASQLLEELENLSSKIPAHGDAWQRLVDFVGQQLAETTELRKTA